MTDPGGVAGEDVEEEDEDGHASQGDEVAGLEAGDLHDNVDQGQHQHQHRQEDVKPGKGRKPT